MTGYWIPEVKSDLNYHESGSSNSSSALTTTWSESPTGGWQLQQSQGSDHGSQSGMATGDWNFDHSENSFDSELQITVDPDHTYSVVQSESRDTQVSYDRQITRDYNADNSYTTSGSGSGSGTATGSTSNTTIGYGGGLGYGGNESYSYSQDWSKSYDDSASNSLPNTSLHIEGTFYSQFPYTLDLTDSGYGSVPASGYDGSPAVGGQSLPTTAGSSLLPVVSPPVQLPGVSSSAPLETISSVPPAPVGQAPGLVSVPIGQAPVLLTAPVGQAPGLFSVPVGQAPALGSPPAPPTVEGVAGLPTETITLTLVHPAPAPSMSLPTAPTGQVPVIDATPPAAAPAPSPEAPAQPPATQPSPPPVIATPPNRYSNNQKLLLTVYNNSKQTPSGLPVAKAIAEGALEGALDSIPIVGSGKRTYNAFTTGHPYVGSFFAVLTVVDIVTVGKAGMVASAGLKKLLAEDAVEIGSKVLAKEVAVDVSAEVAAKNTAGAIAKTEAKVVAESAGTSVIGRYPAYENLAKDLKANYFSIPPEIWRKMSAAEQWAANQRFLDKAIARGDIFRLATPISTAKPGTYMYKEIQYLLSKGYHLTKDGSALIRESMG